MAFPPLSLRYVYLNNTVDVLNPCSLKSMIFEHICIYKKNWMSWNQKQITKLLSFSDNALTTVSWRQMKIIILGPKQTKHVWYVERITEYSCIDQYCRQNKQHCSGIIIFTQDFKFTEFVQNEIVTRSESILHNARFSLYLRELLSLTNITVDSCSSVLKKF